MDDRFVNLCRDGKLDKLKKMYQNFNITTIVLNIAFETSCYNNHLNIAQWLYSLGNIDIQYVSDDIFRWSCSSGYLNMAQWIYSIDDVNIHYCDDSAFIWSCSNGYLNIAQWLYSLGSINVHVENDNAFKHSCRYDHLDVVDWLLLIDKFDDEIVDEFLPHQSYEYAFSLGYLPVYKMIRSYVEYKNKIKNEIKENNKNGNISIFELSYLVDIITAYV